MSEITETKTALKKFISIIEEINKLNTGSVPKVKEQPDKVLATIEKFEQERNEKIKNSEDNDEEINTLKNKISQNNRDISNLEETIEELAKERQELTDKNAKAQEEFSEVKNNLEKKQQELANREERQQTLEKTIQDLTKSQLEFEDKLKKIDEELTGEYDKREISVKSYANRVKAMRILVQKDYLKTPHVQLIKALQKDTAIDLKNVLMALDIKEDLAKTILKKMVSEGGPIDYNESGGTVTLKAEVEFK